MGKRHGRGGLQCDRLFLQMQGDKEQGNEGCKGREIYTALRRMPEMYRGDKHGGQGGAALHGTLADHIKERKNVANGMPEKEGE